MRLYPASATARTRTLVRDLVVVGLLAVFAWTGVKTHDAILELTSIGRGIQDSGRAISATTRNTASAVDNAFADAGNAVNGIPLVGGQLGGTLRRAPSDATSALRAEGDEQGGRIVRLGVEQVRRTERAANWVGWLVFLLPSVVLLAWFVPKRSRQVLAMATAHRTLSHAPEHILAARAAYSLDYKTLRRYTQDPFGDLAAGRHDALVTALRRESGLP
ncbi:hypothetical protein DVA67_022480 [Solirubrobacter sp. CPCC 204708]|uniref:DUF4129 domain-containing protein n=1 Tax=Solirubrobacter deserti TaxID=2282478 RepID=A0ABT4RHV8_9ACTN|nr:hypothetical protein [Solirubrobacter deserti]MBE2318759.1 hypothetical protein [Solirubrobacter deserti]MDA0138139.1 hypothetical protein [Solirubrobacter deserti]